MNEEVGYICVPGWGDGVSGVEVGPLVAGDGVDSIDNEDGACSSSLGDYSTLNCSSSAVSAAFTTSLNFNPLVADYDGLVTVALIGLRVTPLTEDTALRGSLVAGSGIYQSACPIYGQQMIRTLPDTQEGQSLMGSGVSYMVFHDLPIDVIASGVEFDLTPIQGSIAGASIRVGSIFVGLQIPVWPDTSPFSWGAEIQNNRYTSRGGNNFSSDGTLQRSMNFAIRKIAGLELITGIGDGFHTGAAPTPNLFRAVLSSIGAPMLLSPWPYAVEGEWTDSPDTAEIEQRQRSIRQNFFACYGLMDRRMEIGLRDFQNKLASEYNARLHFSEIR